LGGHQRVTRTVKKIKEQHDWKGLSKQVKKCINNFEICQRNKAGKKSNNPWK